VIAGAFDESSLRPALERAFAGWEGIVGITRRVPVPERVARQDIHVAWDGASQAEIRIAGIGIPRTSADWIPAAVTNYLLGGSTITGRLGLNLREERGWTYGVRSAFSSGMQAAGWSVDTAVERDVAEQAVGEIIREINGLIRNGVSAEELRRAKEAMILSLPRAFETPARIVGRFATQEAFALGDRYWEEFSSRVESVTQEDVQRIARELFDPEHLIRVVVS
jgi:zinc protease